MRHSDYRTLIDRGRKAGLGTNELYCAIGARPPEVGDLGDLASQNADSNGFVSDVDAQGQRRFRPVGYAPSS